MREIISFVHRFQGVSPFKTIRLDHTESKLFLKDML